MTQDAHDQGTAAGGVETEIKLVGRSLDASDILDHPAVLSLAVGPVESVSLRAVYLDTPSFALHRAGAALRVRSEGDRFLLTAKSAGKDGGFSRLETEVPVASLEPDRDSLIASLPPELAKLVGEAELHPVFRTEVERRKVLVDASENRIELALDKGFVLAGERREPIIELELELKNGSAAALWRLARDIGTRNGLRPSLVSKSERGYALAAGSPPGATKSRTPELDAGLGLDDALDRILRSAFQHFLENQPAAEDGRDVEALHQFRVALRRLRALFKLLRGLGSSAEREALEMQAKTMMAPLNAARALDVLVTQTLSAVAPHLPDLEGMNSLRKSAEEARSAAYDRIREEIADSATCRFELELGLWIEERGWRGAGAGDALAGPAADFAVSMLKSMHRKVLKRGRGFKDLPAGKRHKVRIAVKNLRYCMDFLLPLLPSTKDAKSFGRMLGEFQDRLGDANDRATLPEVIRPLMTEALDRQGHAAAGAMLGWAAAQARSEEKDLRAAWKAFRKAAPPW